MIYSLTGYGKATQRVEDRDFMMEIKSLNSKGLDIYFRLPQEYRSMELALRKLIGEKLIRGKVEVHLNVMDTQINPEDMIDMNRLAGYLKICQKLAPDGTSSDWLAMALRMPEVFSKKEEDLKEEESEAILRVAEQAIEELQKFRKTEGEELMKDLWGRCRQIERLLLDIAPYEEERKGNVKTKIQQSLNQMETNYDENRLEQELIFYLEKLDITEEKVRLNQHISYFLDQMDDAVSNGKKLGFICQEMGREINTLGSKANHAEIQKSVVQMKDELEKIKEQLLNVV